MGGGGHSVGVKRPDTKRPRGETIRLGQEMDLGRNIRRSRKSTKREIICQSANYLSFYKSGHL